MCLALQKRCPHSFDDETWVFTCARMGISQGPCAGGRLSVLAACAGDNQASASRVGRKLGIAEVHAGLSPQEKLDAVETARQSGGSRGSRGVVMVRILPSQLTQGAKIIMVREEE